MAKIIQIEVDDLQAALLERIAQERSKAQNRLITVNDILLRAVQREIELENDLQFKLDLQLLEQILVTDTMPSTAFRGSRSLALPDDDISKLFDD